MPGQVANVINHGKDDGQNSGALWDLGDPNIYQHPLMRPFRGWQDYDLVTNPRGAFTFWDVQPRAPDTLVLVRYLDDQHHAALLERTLVDKTGKAGKVLLFTTPLDARKPRWNNYLENSMFVGLTWLGTNYLAVAAETPGLNFICGQETPAITLPPNVRYINYALLKNRSLVEKITAAEVPGALKLPQADAPGNYTLEGLAGESESGAPIAAFSVNTAAEESDLSRVPTPRLKACSGPTASCRSIVRPKFATCSRDTGASRSSCSR